MATVEVRTQEELDAALARGDYPRCVGGRVFVLSGTARADLHDSARADLYGNARADLDDSASADLYDSASAVLYGNASAVLYGNARAVLYGNARADLHDSARADLYGNARADLHDSARADLYGNASAVLHDSARAVLYDSASVRAFAHSFVRVRSPDARVTASPQAVVALHCDNDNIIGGVVVRYEAPATAEAWCAHYGVSVKDGVATLYKGVREDFTSVRGGNYTPGTIPVAPDWDGGISECGGGLHFSPTPRMTRAFIDNPKHYVACPVALKDIAVHPDGEYPAKVKARGCCAPVWECDEDGEPIKKEG